MTKPPQMNQDINLDDHFEKAAAKYEDQASMMKEFAKQTISFVLPISSQSVVHDNASGPGIVTGEILPLCDLEELPEIHATDYSQAMIAVLRKKNWSSKVHSAQMDARELQFPDDKFTHSFTNFAIMAIPEPEKVAHEIYRTLRLGGTAIVTTIKHTGYMIIFNDAQKKVRPNLLPFPGPIPAEWLTNTKLRDVLVDGGFKLENIEFRALQAEMSSAEWAKGLEEMRSMLFTRMTNGWSDGDKGDFKLALKEQFEHEATHPRPIKMEAWVAIARK